MKGLTLILIATTAMIVAMFQPQGEAAKVPKTSIMEHLHQPKHESDLDTSSMDSDLELDPFQMSHAYEDYDGRFPRGLLDRKRNANGYGYPYPSPFENPMKKRMMKLKRKSKRSSPQYEEAADVGEQQGRRQQSRPGCCPCGDHLCCNSMCHGK